MISIDNMILFIFITICILFGIGISAVLRIYSRRHQANIENQDPFSTADIESQTVQQQNLEENEDDTTEYSNNRRIFVIDINIDPFYKHPPPKYSEEMPPSYEEVIRNTPNITTATTSGRNASV